MKITHYFQKAEPLPSMESGDNENVENKENADVSAEERRIKMMQNGTKRVEKALLSVDRELFVKNIATLSRLPDRYFELIPNPFIKYALKKELALRNRIAALKRMTKQEKLQYKRSHALEVNPRYDVLLTKFLAEKYEDTLLELKEMLELPTVPLPDGSNTDEFDACLHITQFLFSTELLLRHVGALITKLPSAESLLASIYQSKEGFAKGPRAVLFTLSYFLIEDGYKKDCKKLGNYAALVRANLSSNNVFKLVKLLLVGEDPTEPPTSNESDEFFDRNEDLQGALLALRECSHFSMMTVAQQLEIMRCLVDKAMLRESFSNFITDDIYITDANNELKELQNKLAGLERELSELPPPVIDENAVQCRSRRRSAELALTDKLRMQKIDEHERVQQAVDMQLQYVKEMKEVNRLRISPLGTDRFHRAYWFFKESPNQGVFVEETKEGDVVDNYKIEKKRQKKDFLSILEENVCGRCPPEYNKPVRVWRKLETKEAFDALCESLNPNGVREGVLRKKLLLAAGEILKSFPKTNNIAIKTEDIAV